MSRDSDTGIIIASICCVLLLLLAGCSQSSTGQTTPTATVEDSVTPTTPSTSTDTTPTTPTPAPTPVIYPNGADETAITDVSALFEAHWTVLENHNYVLYSTYEGPLSLQNASEHRQINETFIILSNRTAQQYLQVMETVYLYRNGRSTNETEYVEDGRRYVQYGGATADGAIFDPHYYYDTRFVDESFLTFHLGFTRQATLDRHETYLAYDKLFQEHRLRHTDTVRQSNQTYHIYTVTNETTAATAGKVVVRADGLIRALEIRTQINGRQVQLTRNYKINRSVSIPTPHWKEKARRQGGFQGAGSDSSCGTNDGDQSYVEDNDRDNDGLCDES